MRWGQYLFSFQGRINRARYWFFLIAGFLFYAAGFIVALPYIVFDHRSTAEASHSISVLGAITICVEAIVVIAFFVSVFAVYVKRLHDRDKSAWWLIPFSLVPAIIDAIADNRLPTFMHLPPVINALLVLTGVGLSIWNFVEVGCLRGTQGPNRFGDDPLAT
jgi:uncharacterized membrane protein YhaH (DUF805 family)